MNLREHSTWPLAGISVIAILVTLALLARPSLVAEEPLTNEDLVRLVEAGLEANVIIAKVESSETAFDTSVDALVNLADSGVANEVLAAMLAAGDPPERVDSGLWDESTVKPGMVFRERLQSGDEGPQMIVIPQGSFRMGCLSNDEECALAEKPSRSVQIATPFAVSVYEVTFEDYDHFTFPSEVDDQGWGRDGRPVINVSWDEAQDYVAWLSSQTGAQYRLLSDAEWEYVARAGTSTKYSWGNGIGVNRANCGTWRETGSCADPWEKTAPVGSFEPNAFGVYDMHGNVWEWVEDCWNESYRDAPTDASAWTHGDCGRRVLRGGSWVRAPAYIRSASRDKGSNAIRGIDAGFRIARTIAG